MSVLAGTNENVNAMRRGGRGALVLVVLVGDETRQRTAVAVDKKKIFYLKERGREMGRFSVSSPGAKFL